MAKSTCSKILIRSLKSQTKEFLKNSTLHGVNYIADESLNFLERLAWLLICCLGVVSTAVTIALLWEKFQTNPTITGLDTDFHDWNVPFPAITLCAEHPFTNEYINNFISKWNSTKNILAHEDEVEKCPILEGDDYSTTFSSDGDKKCLSTFLINLACLHYNHIKNFKAYQNVINLPQDDLRSLTLEVVAHCEDIFKDCKWKGEQLNSCCAPENPLGMRPMFTDHGFCYSFNSHKAEKSWPWLSTELKENKVLEIYETDENWDFSFNVKDVKHYPVKVFIHDWDEVPATDDYPQHEWDGFVGHLEFSAKTTYTTPETRQLSVKQRQCVFPDEIKLVLDPEVYTHSVCVRECHANEAMEICGCVPPLISEIAGKFKHCNLTGMSCLAGHKSPLRTGKSCTCELSCMNTVYEVEKLIEGSCKGNQCQPLHIGFVSWPMVRYKREVLFGWVDLLVSFGGVAGLFLGFSLLSGVEIIYYFVVRTVGLILVTPTKQLRKRNTQTKRSKKLITKGVSFNTKEFMLNDSMTLKSAVTGRTYISNYGNKKDIKDRRKSKNKHSKKSSVIEFPNQYLP